MTRSSARSPGPRAERLLERMRREMVIRGYSAHTRRNYLGHARRFLARVAEARAAGAPAVNAGSAKAASTLVRAHLLFLLEERALSHSYADQAVSALKFLFAHVLGRELVLEDLPRPKRQRKLPVVLTRAEIRLLVEGTENLKHRAILLLGYGAGLRVGENVRVETRDIDRRRRLLHVRQAKGRKDRIVPLARTTLVALERYAREARPRTAGHWLFPGQRPGRHLHARSVQKMFIRLRDKAGITKPATVHTLRHSIATHMLQDGVDLRYIQEFLGHASPQTTQIYTRVTTGDLARIRNPVDDLWR